MIALDTNFLVRLLTHDNKAQTEKAVRLLENHEAFIPKTVLLELEMVLRCSYRIDAQAIYVALQGLLGLPQVFVEDDAVVEQAMDWFGQGLDFAHALHLASSKECRVASFDRSLVSQTRRLSGAPGVFNP